MALVRVGDKVSTATRSTESLTGCRSCGRMGCPRQKRLPEGIDRSRPRIENLGEVRKGKRVALIASVGNKAEIEAVAQSAGKTTMWLMNDGERYIRPGPIRHRASERCGMEISGFQQYDQVIFLGSDFRVRLIEAILGDKVSGVVIGRSPIHEDVKVDPHEISAVIAAVRGGADR